MEMCMVFEIRKVRASGAGNEETGLDSQNEITYGSGFGGSADGVRAVHTRTGRTCFCVFGCGPDGKRVAKGRSPSP